MQWFWNVSLIAWNFLPHQYFLSQCFVCGRLIVFLLVVRVLLMMVVGKGEGVRVRIGRYITEQLSFPNNHFLLIKQTASSVAIIRLLGATSDYMDYWYLKIKTTTTTTISAITMSAITTTTTSITVAYTITFWLF